jgi:uncharacterized protein YkwD
MGLFTADEYERANTAVNVKYLSDQEKEVIRHLNLVRMDGTRYYESYIQSFVDRYNAGFTPKIEKSNKYVKSLKSDLKKIKGLSILQPDEKLAKAAAFHAEDMGKTGNTGHNSTDGTDCFQRIKRFIGTEYNIAENCAYGFGNAEDIVPQLLIDNGVTTLGHRKNILNPAMKRVGVGIDTHKVFKFNCVMDFYLGE